jgi:hypothetical protein
MTTMLKYRYVGICEKEGRARKEGSRQDTCVDSQQDVSSEGSRFVREGFLVFSPRYVSRVCIGSFEKLEGVVFP